jgi:hypothetical protein
MGHCRCGFGAACEQDARCEDHRHLRALQSLGDVSSELFVPMVETRTREHLRDDKLQRDWEWTLDDRR